MIVAVIDRRKQLALRFTLAGVLLIVAVVAWIISVAIPGGVYVHLPAGVVAILAVWIAYNAALLIRNRHSTQRTRHWFHLIVATSVLVAVVGICSAWWPLMYDRYRLLTTREYVRQPMHSVAIRDVGRRLMAHHRTIGESGELKLAPADWPREFSSLRPSSVLIAHEVVTLRFGKLGLGEGFCVFVFRNDIDGYGTERLAPGVWLFESGAKRWKSEREVPIANR